MINRIYEISGKLLKIVILTSMAAAMLAIPLHAEEASKLEMIMAQIETSMWQGDVSNTEVAENIMNAAGEELDYYYENYFRWGTVEEDSQDTAPEVEYDSCLGWPLPEEYGAGSITSTFGYRTHPVTGEAYSFHQGMDIGAPQGTPIYACERGVVVAHGYDASAGNRTVLYHGNGMYTEYMHQNFLGGVEIGQEVSRGEWIGAVGTTGSSTGYHLHIGVAFSDAGYFDGAGRVDPAAYLGID